MTASSSPERVLLTGAGGFLGTALCARLLADGHHVVAVRRAGTPPRPSASHAHLEHAEADLADASAVAALVAATRPDACVHLAAAGAVTRSGRLDAELVAVNALSGLHLAHALGAVGARRLVSCGSSSEYGPSAEPMRETGPLWPDDAYGAAKAAGAHLTLAAARTAGVESVHLRPFSIYGPGERDTRLVAGLVRALVEGRPTALTGGRQARDFVFVDDVADAFARALSRPDLDGRALNVGSGRQTTVRHLALLAADVVGADRSLLRFGAVPYRDGERFSWRASTDLAAQLLGWRATTALADGLGRTADAVRGEINAERRAA